MKMFMTLTLPLEPQEEAKLVAAARARGVSLDALVREALRRIFSEAAAEAPGKEPTRSLRGLLAKIRPCSISRGDRSEPRDVREFSAFRFLMVVAIADTHTTLWYLFSDRGLGVRLPPS